MVAQEARRPVFIDLTGRDSENESDQVVLTGFDAVTVEVQEKVGRHIGSALVSVHKRVVFRDAEQVGGSENEKIILAIEMLLFRPAKGRLQHAFISQASGTAMQP